MIYQIKVKLKEIRPPIQRTIQVRDSISLPKLHGILQIVMGWEHYHLHKFEIAGRRYGPKEHAFPGLDLLDTLVNEKKVKLSELIRQEKAKFLYTYDFGDNWRHQLLVEKIIPARKGQHYPVCIGGKRACPPEDCGGTWGYYGLLKALQHPDDPRYEERREWMGEFDPEQFDLGTINSRLKKIK